MPLPATTTAAPVGQKGPRAAILVELKRATQLTALELAGKLRASMNAIRHHLKELEAERLVEYDRVRHGVGAPAFAYRLSAAGEALFPRRYEETLLRVLEHVVEREGRQAAVSVLESRYRDLARELGPQMVGAPSTRRLEMVSRALGEAGYMAEWEGTEDGERGTLTEHNSPSDLGTAIPRSFCGSPRH